MPQVGLNNYFEQFLEKESLFQNKKVLQANYIPEVIPHRKRQMEFVASILAVSLRNEKPSNLFIYGKTGTGKTTVIHHISESLIETAKKKDIPLKTIYVNCKLKKKHF